MATQPLAPTAIEARAAAMHVRLSPQKARLVMDQIRGQRAADALQILRFTKKRAARDIEKVLRSAIANAENKADTAGESLDVDELYISRCFVNEGARWKRIRPAPFGRAYRYVHRTSHIVIEVAEHGRAAAGRAEAAAAEAARSKGVAGAVRKARKALAVKKTGKKKKSKK
jgi:large subunit ribosomal protein L22